jgi:hypothetical protein
MDCYTGIKLKCLELVVDQSQVAGLMKSLCLAALLLVVFPAADLFEEANVDSSLVTAIPVPAPLSIAGNSH